MKHMFQTWLSKRFLVDDFIQLNQSKILIFIFGQGYVYVGLILVSFIAGINYGNNLILAFCFLIAAILWMSFYITFKQLHQIEIEVVLPDVAQAKRSFNLQLHCKQPKALLRYLQVEVEGKTHAFAFNQRQQCFEVHFHPEHRGYFHLPRIKIYSTYPFGLVRAWSYLYFKQGLWVAPSSAEFNPLQQHQQAKRSDELEEFRELRNFVVGDALQTVSWKHLARGQGLMVKVFDDQLEQQHIHIDYAHIPAATHEQKLSLMMALIECCEQRQSAYGLTLPKAELALGLGEGHGVQARQLLAQA